MCFEGLWWQASGFPILGLYGVDINSMAFSLCGLVCVSLFENKSIFWRDFKTKCWSLLRITLVSCLLIIFINMCSGMRSPALWNPSWWTSGFIFSSTTSDFCASGCQFMVKKPNSSPVTFPVLLRTSLMVTIFFFLISNEALCVGGREMVIHGQRSEFHVRLT